jgi:hypothetical protein
MRTRALLFNTLVAALLAGCGGGGGSPTAPPPAGGDGALFFVDSGCSCETNPPAITIFVDGKQAGFLPALGTLNISLAPGNHTWSDSAGVTGTTVVIQTGKTITENLQSNFGCVDGCTTDDARAIRH